MNKFIKFVHMMVIYYINYECGLVNDEKSNGKEFSSPLFLIEKYHSLYA